MTPAEIQRRKDCDAAFERAVLLTQQQLAAQRQFAPEETAGATVDIYLSTLSRFLEASGATLIFQADFGYGYVLPVEIPKV